MAKLYKLLASAVQARLNCIQNGNVQWKGKHEDAIGNMVSDYMPSGSGINNGTEINLDESTGERLVFSFNFQHMNEGGFYGGWTSHGVILTSSLQFGIEIRITGEDRNGIKDYLHEVFSHALASDVP